MRDVARAAGVSPATVSNVLNARRNVDSDIAARVNEAVRALGYRVNAVAANLRKAQPSIVGLIIPDFQNPFFGELVARMERRAEATGRRLVAVSSREDEEVEKDQVRALIDWRVAGLIVVPTAESFASRAIIDDAGLTAVVIDRAQDAAGLDAVTAQNADAAATAYRHLYDQGHRRVLAAVSSERVANMRERLDGARAAARERACEDALEVIECGTTVEQASERLAERFAREPWPTAVLALFNIATLATLKTVARAGARIPDDLSLIGFDDYEWMQVAHPPVTAVAQPVGDMADIAWDRLMCRLDGDEAPHRTVRIACTLLQRGSVAPPRTQDHAIPGARLARRESALADQAPLRADNDDGPPPGGNES